MAKLNADGTIDITGMDKAEVLMLLWNGGHNDVNHGPMAGLLQRMLPAMTIEKARAYIERVKEGQTREPALIYFDYVEAKALKVDLTGDKLDPRLYDRDCGQGAAARALGAS